jgi:hypothetical protein
MSTTLQERVLRMTKTKPCSGPHELLKVLTAQADPQGCCSFALPDLIQRVGLSERHVQRLLKRLDVDGEISYRPGCGRGKKSMCVVLVGMNDGEGGTLAEKGDSDAAESKMVTLTSPLIWQEKGDSTGTLQRLSG